MSSDTTSELDKCIYCGRSTTFGSGNFVNRLPVDDEWACADCAGFECTECGKQIYLDCEIRVDYTDTQGTWHYGNYHEECYNEEKHGKQYEYED